MSEEKISVGDQIQIEWLKSNLPVPKWESTGKWGMSKVSGAWNEKWEQKERQKVLDKIEKYKVGLMQSLKSVHPARITKSTTSMLARQLVALGSIGTIGAEELLKSKDILDDDFIQEIVDLITKGDLREEGAYALLGVELARKEGEFVPVICEVFDETLSFRIARHLGKITWNPSVVDSLIRATSFAFLHQIPDGLYMKNVDGVGLLASLSLLELKDERGIREMVPNLLQLKNFDYADNLLIQAGDMVVPYLIQGLKLDDINAQARAAECLGKIGNATAISALLQLLGHKQLNVRSNAKGALRRLKKQWEPELFMEALSSGDEKVVLYAIDALLKMKSEKAIEQLTNLLKSDNKKVVKAAEKAIKKLN